MRHITRRRVLTGTALIPMTLALTAGVATAASKPTASKPATSKPAAALVRAGDAICKADNVRRAHNPNPPAFGNPAKATKAQLRAAAPYMTRDTAITKSEVHRVFGLGTPSEPAARKQWTRLHAILTTQLIPTFERHVIPDMRAGNRAAVLRDFGTIDRISATQGLLLAELGFKVCGH